jgi:hypothetical protein
LSKIAEKAGFDKSEIAEAVNGKLEYRAGPV